MSGATVMAAGSIYITLIAVLGLVWLWVAAVKRPRVRQPGCGQCGYPVEGLEGLTCPECGGDFRAVGIVTPTQRMMRPVVFIVIWTVLLPIPGALVTRFADRIAPSTEIGTVTFVLEPRSGSFPPVRITQSMRRDVWGPVGGISGISVSSQSSPPEGTVTTLSPSVMNDGWDRAAFELQEASGAGKPVYRAAFKNGETVEVEREGLALWALSLAGSSDRESVVDDVDELAALIESRVLAADPFSLRRLTLAGGVSTMSTSTQPWWFVAAMIAFWVVVYLGGIAGFMVVRRRRLRAPAQGASARTS